MPNEIEETAMTEADSLAVAGKIPPVSSSFFAKLNLLFDEWRFIALMTLFGLVCSAALSLVLPKRFEATARLMPPDSGDNLSMLSAVADKAGAFGGMAGSLLGIKSSSDQLVGILSSNTLQDRLITRYDLKKIYGASYQEDVRARLADNTGIGVDRKSGIISITVTDRDPQRAAAMANSYVDELNTLVAQLSTSSARREREFLEERLGQIAQDLEKAEKELSQFSSKSGTVNIQEQGKAMVESAASLQSRLIQAEGQLAGLRATYTEDGAPVRALKAEIARLRLELQKMGGKAGVQPNAAASAESYPSIRQLPLLGVTYADLYRRARIEEAVFETLTKQYELAKVQEVKEIPSVRFLDRPGIPQKKSYPPRTVITIIGTLFSFGFAVLWTLGAAQWEAADPEAPGKLFARKVWGAITLPFRKKSNREGDLSGKAQIVRR